MTFGLVQILVSLFVGSSVFLLIWSVFRFPVASEPPVHRRIAVAMGMGKRNTVFEQPLLARIMQLALAIADRFNIGALRRSIKRNLDASGNPNHYSVEEYVAICLVLCVFLSAVASVLTVLLLGGLNLLVVVVMGLVGLLVPVWALHGSATSRVMRISRQLPYTLDLIALMMAAGSTFTEAIETIIHDAPQEDLNQELRLVQAEIEFGSQRATALSNMAGRIPLQTLRSVVGAVNQAEVLGTPLSTILKSQSDMMRMHRSVRVEKLSASASLRILFPTMLILIAVVIIVFGPFVVQWIAGTLV